MFMWQANQIWLQDMGHGAIYKSTLVTKKLTQLRHLEEGWLNTWLITAVEGHTTIQNHFSFDNFFTSCWRNVPTSMFEQLKPSESFQQVILVVLQNQY